MASGTSTQLLDTLDLRDQSHPGFYASLEEVEQLDPPPPHAHAVRRAWKEMNLNGVLYVDRSPAAYFREVKSVTDKLIRRLQRTLWNQAVAPLLVIISPAEVRVYSGQVLPARDDEAPDENNRLVEILDRTSDILEIQQLVSSIETGRLFGNHPKSFDREHSVDRYLLRNLDAVRLKLSDEEEQDRLDIETVHGLLTRLLFACYLIAREIIIGDHFSDPHLSKLSREHRLGDLLESLSPSKARSVLYRLFGRLKTKFNGSLFDTDLIKEKSLIKDRHMEVIQSFLKGDDLGNRQLSLRFWAYDFSIIPIETISAIYEGFLDAEGPTTRRLTGAYYTPPHLAELLVDIAIEGWDEPLLKKRILDPACGSGVFLVSVFNRMAEQWRIENPRRHNGTRAEALINILKRQIFGIDTHETACRITCFSLYLALLDHLKPRDIEAIENQGRRLPRLLLRKGKKQNVEEPRSIVCGNFFDPELSLASNDFDLVIGNPPWVSGGKSKDPYFLAWVGDERDVKAPQKQIAHGFMRESPKYLVPNGRACLLLPSAVLHNRTDKFQKAWFQEVNVEKVVNLSDLSFILFPGSDRPAIVARFVAKPRLPDDELIAYESPKADITSQLGGPIHIYQGDVTSIRLSEILATAEQSKASMLWKSHFWGTPRDLRLLDRLGDMPRLEDIVGTPRNPKRLIKGRGFQPERLPTDRKRAWWKPDHLFVMPGSLSLCLFPDDCEKVGNRFRVLHRCPQKDIFQPPMVLVSEGARNMKIAFCDFPVIFKRSIYSIAGGNKDSHLLRFLAAVVESDVAQYYLFHTSSSWGTERDRVLFYELLRLPFSLPTETNKPDQARDIMEEVSRHIQNMSNDVRSGNYPLGRQEAVEHLRRELEPLIRQYYDINEYEEMLIEDTLEVFKRSSTPGSAGTRIPTLRQTVLDDRKQYVSTLCGVLNGWASRSKFKVSGAVTYAGAAGQAIVTLTKAQSPSAYKESDAPGELKEAMKRISDILPQSTGNLIRHRGLKVFEQNHIYILKPLTLRSWTRTAALNDADEIASGILGRKRGN